MRRTQNESLDRMKMLFEYHFKSSGSERESLATPIQQEETPVKFSEIGDKYSNLENDFPSFSEYRDEVMIDEDVPEEPEQNQAQPVQQDPQQQPAPEAPVADPAPQAEVPAPAPEPVQPPSAPVADSTGELETKLNDQIAKTDQMLNTLNMIQANLSQQGQGGLDAKIDQVAKEVEDIKNPSYDKQFDMISKNSYPYNIKLSDYWGWEDEAEMKNQNGEEYTITQADIDNYDPNLIKQTLNLTEAILIPEK